MGRWEPGARGRLIDAAMALFSTQGFAATSVPEIAERAGLTNRTFFRYFSDKREVLFAMESGFPERVSTVVSEMSPHSRPWDLIEQGLMIVATAWFTEQRDFLKMRRAIISSDASLRERDLIKQATLTSAVESGFSALGFAPDQARLSAQLFSVILNDSVDSWLSTDVDSNLLEIMRLGLSTLRDLTSSAHPASTDGERFVS